MAGTTLQKLVEKLPPEEREKVKPIKPSGKRAFHGFKLRLRVELPELAIDVPVRYAKLDSKSIIAEKLRIIHRAPNGEEVSLRQICENCGHGGTKWAYVDGDGNAYPEDQIRHYQILDDGEEIEVEPFQRTMEMKAIKTVPATALDEFLIEAEYEIWAEEANVGALWKLAEFLSKNDAILVAKHTFGRTFYENYAFIYPIIREGQFIFIMALTKMRKEFKRWMPVNGEVREAVRRAKPISILPEI
ncbi:MAG: hypothetical protein QXS76_00175 [Candidatus Bathyarchaeia archaeon]